MTIDLSHLHVLITRSEERGSPLCELIQVRGGDAISMPTLAFAPPEDERNYRCGLKALGEQDWLIFVSPQAVYSSIAGIRREWPEFPPQTAFAAVGAGTAKALREAGYEALYPKEEWSSEGLLSMPEFQSVKGKKMAIIRGDGGREMLDNVLAEKGAQVLTVIAYQRVLPQINVDDYQARIQQHQINTIVAMSFESIKNLKILLGVKMWPHLQEMNLVVASDRIKRLAQDLGFQRIWVAKNTGKVAIVELLQELERQ